MAIPRNLANLANQLDTSGNPPKVQVGDSSVVVTDTGSNGTVTITTDGATAVTVDSGQRTKFPTTIGVGNATPSTSGSGITFPATQSASSNANTLDDYEEGTWTPTYLGSTTNPTVTYANARTGEYTKIGQVVICRGTLVTSSLTGGSGDVLIGGLPFAASAASEAGNSMVNIYIAVNNTFDTNYPSSGQTDGTTAILYYKSTTNGATLPLAFSNLKDGSTQNFCKFMIIYNI